MSNQPKISVIVPVYNAEKHLRRCVDSILAQRYTDFELLLIDDGSTDGSGRICDDYAKTTGDKIQVFHKPNGGVSSARNLGLENSHGEWVTFCDADDFVYADWLENYDISNNKEYDIISQGLRADKEIFCGERKECSLVYRGGVNQYLNQLTLTGVVGYLFVKIFKKEIIQRNNVRFNTNVRFQEDELFVLQYLAVSKSAASVPEIGYFYFVPDWGKYLTEKTDSKLYRTHLMIYILQKQFDNCKQLDILHKKKSKLVMYYIEDNLNHWKRKNLLEIRQLLKEGYSMFHLPDCLRKIMAKDTTLFVLSCLMLLVRIYSMATKHKMQYV